MKKQILKRCGCLLASVVFAFVASSAHAATAWFDGEIATKPDLTGGSDSGSWTIPESGGWTAGEGKGEYNNFTDSLTFTATTPKANIASITTSIKFTAKDEVTAEEAEGAKAGLAVVESDVLDDGGTPTGTTELKYFGIVNGAWAELSGTPTVDEAVSVSISLFSTGANANKKVYVNYSIGDTPLTCKGATDILTSGTDASISSVEYLGKGTIASLTGATDAPYVAQDTNGQLYKEIPANKAVTIVNATEYTPSATTIGSCNISDPDGLLTLKQGSLANVGLKVAKVGDDIVIRPNFTSDNGDGTETAPYEIASAEDLEALRLGVANGKFGNVTGQYFQQTADITLTASWAGIGTYTKYTPTGANTYFAGVYDGANHSISGLTFPVEGERNQQGLFRKVYSADGTAEIKNLTVNVSYDASDNPECGAAAVVGVLSNAKITHVTANGSIKGGHACSGIAGMINGDSVLTDVTNNVDVIGYVNGSAKAGGMCNITQNKSGSTTGEDIAGTPKFIRCVNNGAIKGRNPTNGIGGLVGYLDTPIEVEDCEMYGSYASTGSGEGKVGSIFGIKKAGSVIMKGSNKVVAGIVTGDAAFDGLNFATVDEDGVATLVAEPLIADATYKVMAKIAAPANEISLAQGKTIAFDDTLYTTFDASGKIVAADTTTTKIVENPAGTFTCVEKANFSVFFVTNLSEKPYATKEVYEGAKLGEFTTPDPVDGYDGAWADPAPTADDVINAATTYTYNYTAIVYNITVTDDGNGTASAEAETYTIGAEAQMVALTATPADGYKFDKWVLTEKEGVSIDGNTLTIAAGVIGEIAVEAVFAESKIIPIKPDPESGVPEMKVNKDTIAARNPELTTKEAIENYLKTEQANGQPGWVNYALGIVDTAEPILADMGADKVVIDLGNLGEVPADSGITSKIVRIDGEAAPVELEDGEIVLDDDTATETFKVALVLTDKNGAETKVVEKEVGIENAEVEVAEGMESVILSVPFTDMALDSISVANLIKAKNLESGDRVEVYNSEKGWNEGWTWDGVKWAADKDVADAATKYLQPGEGVWFTPKAKKNLFKFGAYSATKPAVEVGKEKWALIANPHLSCEAKGGAVSLKKLIAEPTVDDEFQFETATTPLIFTFDGELWGYNKVTESEKTIRGKATKVRTVTRDTNEVELAPGAGLWYGNGNAETKSVQW